jgi:hypothetical protein
MVQLYSDSKMDKDTIKKFYKLFHCWNDELQQC